MSGSDVRAAGFRGFCELVCLASSFHTDFSSDSPPAGGARADGEDPVLMRTNEDGDAQTGGPAL